MFYLIIKWSLVSFFSYNINQRVRKTKVRSTRNKKQSYFLKDLVDSNYNGFTLFTYKHKLNKKKQQSTVITINFLCALVQGSWNKINAKCNFFFINIPLEFLLGEQ